MLTSIGTYRLARRAGAGLMALGLVVAGALVGASPASAQLSTVDRSAEIEAGEQALRAALERDLGLTGAELDDLLDEAATATELEAELQEELGEEFGGSWFDRESGSLVVGVTGSVAADLVADAGAQAQEVAYSFEELDAVTEDLDALAEADPAAMSDVLSWSVAPVENQVVLTVAEGTVDEAASLVEEYGDAVVVEESAAQPQPTNHGGEPFLDGGISYTPPGCSTGFNLRNTSTGVGYVLTAGHCEVAGNVSHGGNVIGSFVAAFFPSFDDGLIEVTNTAFWSQGPWVWTYPGIVTISGFTDAGVGTPICKSGATTGWTCGTITAKRVTVNYPQGTVFDLTQHNACVEPGDSGGSNVNVSGSSPYPAEGVTSGASLINNQCLENFGMANISWYYPIALSLPFYQSAFGATLW